MTNIKHTTKLKASHTPGPWVTDGGTHVQALYKPTDGGREFYHTIARTDQPLVHPAQQGANARLIAASPKLLEALKFIERHHVEQNRLKGRDERKSKTLRITRAAIAEATDDSVGRAA